MTRPARSLAPIATIVVLALLPLAGASAHEFFLRPSAFSIDVGQAVAIELRVGHVTDADPMPRTSGHLRRFLVTGEDGQTPVPGVEHVHPAGFLRLDRAGTYLLSYESNDTRQELLPQHFDALLWEEGLELVALERERRHELNEPGRERYERCAKALLLVGAVAAGADLVAQTPVGCPLELFPGARGADRGAFQVRFRGAPLRDALVRLTASDGQSHVARSDPQGWVRFPTAAPGAAVVSAVHMVRNDVAGDWAQWRSYWASFSLELPSPPPGAEPRRETAAAL